MTRVPVTATATATGVAVSVTDCHCHSHCFAWIVNDCRGRRGRGRVDTIITFADISTNSIVNAQSNELHAFTYHANRSCDDLRFFSIFYRVELSSCLSRTVSSSAFHVDILFAKMTVGQVLVTSATEGLHNRFRLQRSDNYCNQSTLCY